MTQVEIEAGACGYMISIFVSKIDRRTVQVRLSSDCEAAEKWGRQLEVLNWRDCLGKNALLSPIFLQAAEHLKHPSCPACVGPLKAIEAEVGASLPVNAAIRFVSQ